MLRKAWKSYFFRDFRVFEKKERQEEDDVAQEDFLRADIIYNKYCYNRPFQGVAAPRSLFLSWNSFVGLHPPPRFPAHKFRTLKSLSPADQVERLN